MSIFKKIACCILSTALTCTLTGTSVIATEHVVEYNSQTGVGDAKNYREVLVNYSKVEMFSVTLPKNVTFEGQGNDVVCDYTVEIQGDIAPDHYLRVIPMNGELRQGNNKVPVTVSQDKRRWDATEAEAGGSTTGTFTASGLSSGKWDGVFVFNISVGDTAFWRTAGCASWAYVMGYDNNDNAVFDNDERVSRNIYVGRPLGHTFHENQTGVLYKTCLRCEQSMYAIGTPEELTLLKDTVNAGNSPTTTVYLLNDIDMSTEEPWTDAMGTTDNPVKFSLEGNGHTIANLRVHKINGSATDGTNYVGFIGKITGKKGVDNLTLKNPEICFVTTEVAGTKMKCVGGMFAYAAYPNYSSNIAISGGVIQAVADKDWLAVGGITALAGGTSYEAWSIQGTQILVDNTGSSSCEVGGLVGRYTGAATGEFVNCYMTANIDMSCKYYYYGSIVGKIYNADQVVNLTNCVVLDEPFRFAEGVRLRNDTETVYSSTNSLVGTLSEVTSQTAVDILNTGIEAVNSHIYAVMDLTQENNGYPYFLHDEIWYQNK